MGIVLSRAIASPLALALILWRALPGFAEDMPQGWSVAEGSATIIHNGTDALSVQQTSDRAVINWHSFSVGAGQSVNFIQPGSGSAILNRVTGETRSTIAGAVSGNGQVFLVNPNGIFLTPSGTVSAQGFVASSLDVSNPDFMAGRLRFHGNGTSAKVENAGSITGMNGGFAALLGGSVENSGVLVVPMGRIGLGAGERATLDLSGDGFLQVALPGGEGGADTAITQSGTISADGGLVQIEAATARDAARNVVRLSGSVSARTVSGRNGAIIFGAGDAGHLQVSARVDASDAEQRDGGEIQLSGKTLQLDGATLDATSAGSQGGTVIILGDQIALDATGIDVSGARAGGTILIGGGPYGMGTFQRAQTLTVDSQTSLRADGKTVGSAGSIVLWSDIETTFFGAISARGGSERGDGGFAEVSSAGRLTYGGMADLRASRGRTGDLLLDPYNITISAAPDGGMAGFTANADSSNINTTTLETALATANVTVSTGLGGTQAGDITVASPLTWSGDTRLTLSAAGDIRVNAAITASGSGSDLTLQAAGSGGISGSGNIAANGILRFDVTDAAGSGTLAGVVSGSGSLIKNGTGSLTLTAANTYTGGTTVAAGTLAIGAGAGGRLGGGNISIATGAQLRFDTTAYHGGTQILGNLSGSGTVEVGGLASNGIVRFSGDNSAFTGAFRLNSGARAVLNTATSGSAAASFIIDGLLTPQATGATLRFGSLEGSGTISLGGGTSNTTLEIGGTGSSTSFAGNIGNVSDSISLRKVGSGTLTLGGTYTYTGVTTVNEGTLTLAGHLSRSGATANIAVASGATLNGGGRITSNTLSHSGGGAVNLTGSNAIARLTSSGIVGAFTLNNTRDLTVEALNATGPVTLVANGATSDLTLVQPIATTATGDAIVLAAGRNFVNSVGATAMTTGAGGRFLVYSTNWEADTTGGLTAGRLYNRSYASNPPSSLATAGPLFLYSRQPLLTVQANDATRSYGEANPTFTATVTGLVNGDTAAQALGGSPIFTTLATAASGIGTYAVTPGTDPLSGPSLGYGFNFVDGRLDVTPRAITVTADDLFRIVGRPNPALSYRIGGLGLVNGDVLTGGLETTANITSVSGRYSITQGTLAASGNYDLAFLNGTLTLLETSEESLPGAHRFAGVVTAEGTVAADLLQFGLQANDVTCFGPHELDAHRQSCDVNSN